MANPASREPVAPEQLALQRLYHWEKTAPGQVILTQPQGGGAIRDFTWGEAISEVRRMAAHLRSLGFPPGSRIAILSKNCAHWLLADFAIWMAGHVSVPLYPTLAAGTIRQILEHSESKLLFVGKLDGWEAMRPGVPAGLACIGLPLAPANDFPQWDAIVAATAPLAESPVRDGNELSTIMYTSGTTGMPKGVMHSFATFAWSIAHRPEARADRQQRPPAELPAAGACRGARPGRACAAGHRDARVLRREPRDLHRRPAAGATDRLLLGSAPVGQVPAGGQREDAAGKAAAAAAHSDRARPGLEEGPACARPRRLRPRRRRRRADAARAAALVCPPRPAGLRGLRHDRKLRRLACHPARRRAARHRRPAVRRCRDAHRPGQWRDPDAKPRRDARLLQGAGPHVPKRSTPTAGCIPATRARSIPRATCESPAGSRTCSRRARGSTCRRRRSRTGW